jgi:teichuronic acid biosynthesis glycosyltransferase TuaC
MIKKLCIITDGYTSEERPFNEFVDQLVCQFRDQGIDCTVISPLSLTNVIFRGNPLLPYFRERKTPNGNMIAIYSPRYLSAASVRKGIINTTNITLGNFIHAAQRTFKKLHDKEHFDAVYAHFIFESGAAASCISEKYSIPAFVAYGECSNYSIDCLGGADKARARLKALKGVISVSTANKESLVKQNIFPEEIIRVFINSIDNRLFYKRNKQEMRIKYGLPEDAFIAAFVGRFVEGKGANRLSKAIEGLGGDRVKSIFIGSGDIRPDCEGILLCGSQPHDRVPELLSAADIFVLPTLAEGCCNAIIEAMACGLPIISADLPFNDDILDETCSIRVDPSSVDEIAAAIKLLLNDQNYRSMLAEGALAKAKDLSISTRATKILEFMNLKTGDI